MILLRRFDREGKRRIPFLSAMSMPGAMDNESRSYLEIVDALRQHGAAPKSRYGGTLAAAGVHYRYLQHRRHLRNHGFLYAAQEGLAPVAGIRSEIGADRHQATHPDDGDQRGRQHSIARSGDGRWRGISIRTKTKPAQSQKEVGHAVSKWRDEAARHGLGKTEIDRMASAFEHDDLKAALG